MPDDQLFPVEWAGRQAVISFPEQIDVSNADLLRDRLLSVISRGPGELIADMTGTRSCDHAAVDTLARACQRAMVSGTQFKLVVADPVIRRVRGLEGLDRVVPIYPSREAAAARPPQPRARVSGSSAGPAAAGGIAPAAAGGIVPALLWQMIDALGDGLALTVRAAHQGYRVRYARPPHSRPMGERVRLAGLRKDGATFPVEISLNPVPTTTERFVLAVIREATETRGGDDLAKLARAAVADQWRGSKDLLDRVTPRLFQVGLSLQAAADLPGDVARECVGAALDQLDDVIHEIRDYAFSVGDEGPC